MDDDLLADDGQYKDDGLDDLDIDAEAALLGLSDEEIEDEKSLNDDQELEYVDEDGNPVTIGENNADLYEVANIQSDKLSNPPDEDILELDLDAELESFTQENSELRESPTPVKTYNDRQRKENLIPLTSRNEPDRNIRRKEARYSPEKDQDRSNKDITFSNQSHSSRHDHRDEIRDAFGDELEYDEESEDESIADDHRERFKSERSNIITLTPAKRRTDIPDTLESVISKEETAKVQAFLENEQKRKMRFKGKIHGRMKPSPRFPRPNQNFSVSQGQQSTQFSCSVSTSMSQTVSSTPQPRKILINPHFRGVRLPPSAEQTHVINEAPQVSVPPTSYDTSNFLAPAPQYSHQEHTHSISIAPPPIYTAPPPSVPYKHPEYPPQQHLQQMPPPVWQQPPDMTVQSYSNPPPVYNYGDPVPQPPLYSNYNQTFQNATYQTPPAPLPPTVNYTQPPPAVHLHSQSFPSPPMNQLSPSMTHSQFPPTTQGRMQHISVQSQSYQEQTTVQQRVLTHTQKSKFTQNVQRFSRPEKRSSNLNIKHIPIKQARMDHPQRKLNIHVNNSNIREIPLVDMLPTTRKPSSNNKVVPVVEDEDEKTRELRMKIEEQKLLREQILKRKEERRRQMAAQRLLELKKRQAEQNKNTVTIVPNVINQNIKPKIGVVAKPVVKPSVKERIGLPLNKTLATTKKKIVVVRKKVQQNSINVKPNTPNSPTVAGQNLKVPVTTQKQNPQQVIKPAVNANAQQNTTNIAKKEVPKVAATSEPPKSTLTSKDTQSKTTVTVATNKPQTTNFIKKSAVQAPQIQRNKVFRVPNKPQFHRQQLNLAPRMLRPRLTGPRLAGPRLAGPRSPQFHPPPFIEHRMQFPNRGPPPMHEMRMPPPHFQEPRPPLLPFHPPGERGPFNRFFRPEMPFEPNRPPFRMHGPNFQHFRPRGMEPMFRERFPPPQFSNQMPPMRPMHENGMQRPPRPRFQLQGRPQKFLANKPNVNRKPVNEPKTVQAKSTPSSTPSQQTPNPSQKLKDNQTKVEGKQFTKICLTRNQPKNASEDKDIPKTQSVSIENLSSSTSENQLKKLCSSVGVIESIQLIKSERKAVIKFKEPCQALNFQKKYQRYMLDLAMIQVSLLPS